MSSDYLWDGSGKPDPEVERLEQLLGSLRYRGGESAEQPWQLPPREDRRPPFRRRARVRWLVAAAVLLAAGLGVTALYYGRFYGRGGTWEVESLAGAPLVNNAELRGSGKLGRGQWLVTDAGSRAEIAVGQIGRVEIEPNTRVRLLETRLSEHRLQLSRGTMHARIWAPPRLFFVDTPSAEAIDLGCAYTLQVDDAGRTYLRVTHGWVALNLKGRESRVPTGAACETRPGVGPGTPHYEDSTDAFRAALGRLDFEHDKSALATVLGEARERDGLTLWHLLSRVGTAERGSVYDRLAALVPPPAEVTREGILRLDERMLASWQDALGI